jgi:hypothetical protein
LSGLPHGVPFAIGVSAIRLIGVSAVKCCCQLWGILSFGQDCLLSASVNPFQRSAR